jgi:two-component system cell cycle response regulator
MNDEKLNLEDDAAGDDKTIIAPIQSLDPLVVDQTPSFLMISGPQIGRTYAILQDEFMIGRAPSCDISIEDDLVSRHHCKVLIKPSGAELVDLGSTNGTLVNGRKITGTVKLLEGDQVQVGAVAILKYALKEEVEAKFLGQLYEAATRDFLTSAYNKKFFVERLQEEFSFAQRHLRELSVLVLDIDHFKKVNDTFGHLAGDIAIKKVAHHLISHTRKDDIVARFGGEEFVILMRDVPKTKAHQLGENLRKGVSEIQIKSGQNIFKITVSVGVATLSSQSREKYASFENLIDEADKRLYEAKTSGRNRVCA